MGKKRDSMRLQAEGAVKVLVPPENFIPLSVGELQRRLKGPATGAHYSACSDSASTSGHKGPIGR